MYRLLVLLLLVFFFKISFAQQIFTITGVVKDSVTKENLAGASLIVEPSGKGLSSDERGHFKVYLKEGKYIFKVSFIGYEVLSKQVYVNNNTTVELLLSPQSVSINDVNVSAKSSDDNLNRSQGITKLDIKQIEQLPSLMGKPDIINAIKLTPGIQAGGEGNTGIYVRGGDAGQNLFIFGDIPLYNPSHLLGFFPLFNSDVVSDVTVVKGAIPAQYGGRISSVIDVSMRESNDKDFAGSGSIGMLASDITLETPFDNGKGSIIVSARQTYIGLAGKVISPVVKSTKSYFENNKYRFFDSSIKLRYSIAKKTRLSLTGFGSKDNYGMKDDNYLVANNLVWKNFGGALKLSHYFNENLNLNFIVAKTIYNYDIDASFNEYLFDMYSGIDDWKYTVKSQWIASKNISFRFGGTYTTHIVTPNKVNIDVNTINYSNNNSLYSDEFSAYISSSINVTGKLKLTAGLRQTFYRQKGPYTQYLTDNIGQIIDTIYHKKDAIIKTYLNFDPSVSVNYRINKESSVKGSVSMIHQYIQLASVGAVSLPTDIWLPSSDYIPPQSATQISAGYFRNFMSNIIETSVEVYYKNLDNQIDFKNGVLDNFDNQKIKENILIGTGQAYGIEFFVKKTVGSTTGWLSYTLSRTFRVFSELNDGNPFPAKYDRIHDFSVTANHGLNEHWKFSAVFVYSTGNAVTLPVGRYFVQGKVANDYSEVNSFRMPSYHRLDLSVDYHFTKRGKIDSWLNFSIYNVYNHSNPFFVYFQAEGNLDEYHLKVSPKQVTMFPVLPSVTWRFKF